MRVTSRTIDDGLAAVNAAAAQFVRAQQQVETGKRLHVPSDDPAATLRVIEGRTEIGEIDAYTRSADTAGARLSVFDTVLVDIVDKLTDAKATAASARGTVADANARAAIAAKLEGIRDALLGDLNVPFRGTFLFSGGEALTEPYAKVAGIWTYQGDSTPVTVDIGRNRSVTIALTGESIAKGSDANDIFTELDALITAVQAADDAAMATGMDAITRAFNRAVRAQSLVGADEYGVEEEHRRLTQLRLASTKLISKDEDANLAEAITQMSQAQTAYEAALEAVGATSRVSLLDFLR